MKKLGERIKKLRRSKHLTQQQLAEILGIDQGAISRWEKNHINPSARYCKKLEEIFEASLAAMNQPLLESVNRDLHFSLLLDANLLVLAASETTVAVNGCRSRHELIGHCYTPLLDKSWQKLYLWLQESGAFNEGVNWVRITMPTPTLYSGYRWIESLWMPFKLDSGELVYRISCRLLDSVPNKSLGHAILEVKNKQLELLIPLQEHQVHSQQQQPSPIQQAWSQAI